MYLLYCTAPDSPPTNLVNVSIGAFGVDIQWNRIRFLNENGPEFLYQISYTSMGGLDTFNITTSKNTATIGNLKPFIVYAIAVSGMNTIGNGPSSTTLTIRTSQFSK